MSSGSKIYNVGVIGYGLSAKIFHIPFINHCSSVRLHAIVQRQPKKDDDCRVDWPGVKHYPSAEELVGDGSVDLVVVTTTPATHFALASLAIQAGKHVVVEKPFTPTSSEAYALVQLANDHNVMLSVYQNRRYDSDFLTLQHVIAQGYLGRVVDFETHFDRHRPDMPVLGASWKTDPAEYSVVFDLGTHLIDQVVALYGLPQQVTGFVGTQRESNTVGLEDSFTAILRWSNTGLVVTAKAGVVSAETEQLRFWVRGTKGSFKKFHLDPQEEQLRAGWRPGDEGYGLELSDRYATLTTAEGPKVTGQRRLDTLKTTGYTAFYDGLASALVAQDSRRLPVDATMAADVIRLVELVRKSSQEGRTLSV